MHRVSTSTTTIVPDVKDIEGVYQQALATHTSGHVLFADEITAAREIATAVVRGGGPTPGAR